MLQIVPYDIGYGDLEVPKFRKIHIPFPGQIYIFGGRVISAFLSRICKVGKEILWKYFLAFIKFVLHKLTSSTSRAFLVSRNIIWV